MRDLEAIGLMILCLLAMHIVGWSNVAKNDALVMRYEITKAKQELATCRK